MMLRIVAAGILPAAPAARSSRSGVAIVAFIAFDFVIGVGYWRPRSAA
jgi:hypothetical protein